MRIKQKLPFSPDFELQFTCYPICLETCMYFQQSATCFGQTWLFCFFFFLCKDIFSMSQQKPIFSACILALQPDEALALDEPVSGTL